MQVEHYLSLHILRKTITCFGFVLPKLSFILSGPYRGSKRSDGCLLQRLVKASRVFPSFPVVQVSNYGLLGVVFPKILKIANTFHFTVPLNPVVAQLSPDKPGQT